MILFLIFLNASWDILYKTFTPKPEGITQDFSGMIKNPAFLKTENISFFTNLEFDSLNVTTINFSLSKKLKKNFGGVSIMNLNAGRETLYYIENGIEETITVNLENAYAIYLSYAMPFSSIFTTGFNFKFATSRILDTYTANAYAVDLGLLYANEYLSSALSIRNIGTSTTYYEKSFSLPIEYSVYFFKTSKRGEIKLTYGVGYERVSSDSILAAFEVSSYATAFYAGYDFSYTNPFLIGLSQKFKNFIFYYSFLVSEILYSHRLAIVTNL
ncbi:MAG: hypothetical protein NZ870_02070 [bacterium]|nr:hypothetical protein [bacterium]